MLTAGAVDCVRQVMQSVPGHGTREALFIFVSVPTCDPGDIAVSIAGAKSEKLRCSMIALDAELCGRRGAGRGAGGVSLATLSRHVCQMLCRETGGTHKVMLDEGHFRELLMRMARPPPASKETRPQLLLMGFPALRVNGSAPRCCAPAEARG